MHKYPLKTGADKQTASAINLALRAIEGSLSGRAGAYEIDEVLVQTDLAAVELKNIGPIRFGAIARDAQGRLKLEGIRLVQGDAKDPELDLKAHLDDTLALRGFALAGHFALDMGGVLTGRKGVTGLGKLRGEVAMSDASGRLRLEKLAAKLEGTPLMSLSLRLAESGRSSTGVGLKLNVPDLAPLASAIGRKGTPGFQVAFDGLLTAGDGAATVSGTARLGNSDLDGRLSIGAPKHKPEITGRMHAKELHLDDLPAVRELPSLLADRDTDTVTVRDDIAEAASLDLDLSADAVAGAGTRAIDLSAHLTYDRSRLHVSALKFAYLGGHIEGGVRADFAHAPPALELKAAVRRLSLNQLFRRLDTAPAASGPLDLDLALSAKGAGLQALLASTSGQASGSIRGGSLANRTINLAGQHIVEWMFTRTADGSAPLLCFVARFDFNDGIGTVRQLVLETDKVQAVGGGTLNLRNETMDLVFSPRPKQNHLIGKVGHVAVSGPLSKPEIELADGAVAAKVVGDTIGLPFHLLGSVLGADGRPSPAHTPCVVVRDRE